MSRTRLCPVIAWRKDEQGRPDDTWGYLEINTRENHEKSDTVFTCIIGDSEEDMCTAA